MKPSHPGAYTNAEGQIIYKGGVVTKYLGSNGNDDGVTFTDIKGKVTRFPGVTVSPYLTSDQGGWTLADGSIHLDPNNGLADLEHEYGHYLDALTQTSYYKNVAIPSLRSAKNDSYWQHLNRSYELRATRLAIDFFGPKSAIATATDLYPR